MQPKSVALGLGRETVGENLIELLRQDADARVGNFNNQAIVFSASGNGDILVPWKLFFEASLAFFTRLITIWNSQCLANSTVGIPSS